MGSWVSYALGSENENLPTFVLPDHRGYASNGRRIGPAHSCQRTQGTTIFPQRGNPIPDLHPKAGFVTPASHRAGIDLINQLNAGYAETRPGDDRLEARIQTYELAARLSSATEAWTSPRNRTTSSNSTASNASPSNIKTINHPRRQSISAANV